MKSRSGLDTEGDIRKPLVQASILNLNVTDMMADSF